MVRIILFSILINFHSSLIFAQTSLNHFEDRVFKNSSVVADDASLKLVSDQFIFTEGPAVDSRGDIFFTDQPNNRIWKYSIEKDSLSIFLENAGRSNGMYFDTKGNLITCADEHNEVWSISPDGKVTVLLKNFDGRAFNGPNDLWISPTGRIYFTDPYYHRDYWKRSSPEIEGQKVYAFEKENKPLVVAEDLEQPNGIIGTQDGKLLYVADIKANKTYRYEIAHDGSLNNRSLFVPMGSDGMTIDDQGNIYLTGKGVFIYNPKGELIEYIPVNKDWTANITFGGKNRDVLFITASNAIYILNMKVRGGG